MPIGVQLEDQVAQGVQRMIEILGRLVAAFLVLIQLRLGDEIGASASDDLERARLCANARR